MQTTHMADTNMCTHVVPLCAEHAPAESGQEVLCRDWAINALKASRTLARSASLSGDVSSPMEGRRSAASRELHEDEATEPVVPSCPCLSALSAATNTKYF